VARHGAVQRNAAHRGANYSEFDHFFTASFSQLFSFFLFVSLVFSQLQLQATLA
jgi:hypothetical protein